MRGVAPSEMRAGLGGDGTRTGAVAQGGVCVAGVGGADGLCAGAVCVADVADEEEGPAARRA
jgi:hypothetical protein